MRAAIALTILSVLGIRADAVAQPWREAYERGDVVRAMALLETLVFDRPWTEMLPDEKAAEALAMIYTAGRGVPQDRILACSLLDLAARAAMARSGLDGPDPRFDRQREEICGDFRPRSGGGSQAARLRQVWSGPPGLRPRSRPLGGDQPARCSRALSRCRHSTRLDRLVRSAIHPCPTRTGRSDRRGRTDATLHRALLVDLEG